MARKRKRIKIRKPNLKHRRETLRAVITPGRTPLPVIGNPPVIPPPKPIIPTPHVPYPTDYPLIDPPPPPEGPLPWWAPKPNPNYHAPPPTNTPRIEPGPYDTPPIERPPPVWLW